jgi:DUF4097 and DUF4098 domain-containing protein YvlB
VKNSNGECHLGSIGGDLEVRSSNGSIEVDVAGASVSAKTALGDVRVGQVERGSTTIESSTGTLEVGIRSGIAAWLDLDTTFGTVTSELDDGAPAGSDEQSVEVRARTGFGDITIVRSPGFPTPGASA